MGANPQHTPTCGRGSPKRRLASGPTKLRPKNPDALRQDPKVLAFRETYEGQRADLKTVSSSA